MPKRKRKEGEEEEEREAASSCDNENDQVAQIRKNRLRAQTEQGIAVLHRALNIARGFERQKLGRRQKNAQGSPRDLLRLEEEAIALRELDVGKTAASYIFKQFVRTRRIRESPAFLGVYGKDTESKVKGPKAGAQMNVVARLMSSNPVRRVVPGMMEGIHRCLGLEVFPSATTTRRDSKNPSTAVSIARTVENNEEGEERSGSDVVQEGPLGTRLDDASHMSYEGDAKSGDKIVNLNRVESESPNSGPKRKTRLKDRLASPSPSISEASSEFGVEEALAAGISPKNGRIHPTREQSPSLSPTSPPSPSQLRQLSKASQANTKPTTTIPPAKITSLPSLTGGGYISGSDSDSDAGPTSTSTTSYRHQRQRKSGPTLPQPRKNRRGQRERRQIAEKKYGGKAKHVLNHQTAGTKEDSKPFWRDVGWDPKKGATDPLDSKKGGGRTKNLKRRRDDESGKCNKTKTIPTGANGETVTSTTTTGTSTKAAAKVKGGLLHPSWEAANKRKQQTMRASAADFGGKKIIFDD